MLVFKHFFLHLTNNKNMNILLIILAILVLIVTLSLSIKLDINYDVYKNLGSVRIMLFFIPLLKCEISFIAGYFNLIRKNKKVIQIKIDLNDKNFNFVKNVSENFKQKIYLENINTNFTLCSHNAYNISLLSGGVMAGLGYLKSKIMANNYDTVVCNNVSVGYLNECMVVELSAKIIITLYDLIWSFVKAVWQGRVYG